MITAANASFALLAVPTFAAFAGLAVLTSIAVFIFGVSHWQEPIGKAAAIISGLLLVLFAVVIFCVLLTVWSGSMG